MNDKSKDTAKARQDLERLGIRSGLWLGQTKNRKCLKPQDAYSFTPEKQKSFDDMLKGQIKVVDILYDLELIYPPALFDIMIHLVIHLPLEALEGGPIRPRWMFPFERYMKKLKDNDKDPEVSTTSELFALACGPTWIPISINSCVVYGVRYVVHNRDERRITQNNGICLPGPDGEMYYGQLQEILEFKYLLFKVMLFRVKWFDTQNQGYKAKPQWKVVEHVNHKKFSDGGVIVVEDDPDIIHFDNSFDLPLSTSLNDLDNATLRIDCQSTEVDAPPDIIDVVDEDDDIINDEDALPFDLADYDDEDLINVDDNGVDKMSACVARSHAGDGGGKDRPPPHYVPTGYGGCFANRGLVLIRFEVREKQTLMPLGEYAAHWSSYIGEVIRGVPLYHPSWLKVSKERKAVLIADIRFDLRPHMESFDWTEIYAGIQQHLQKAYNTNKAAFKAQHWVIDPMTETYNMEKIRRACPQDITTDEWDKGRAQPLKSTRRSLTPSSWHIQLTRNSFGMRTDEMRRLEATSTYCNAPLRKEDVMS
nr:hypothetical protein [Tanacetum cinerariifolium]